jgi:endonuclease YncB( thermonuclease family)
MVSVDTPEKAGFAGRPETAQRKLDAARERLESNQVLGIPDDLRAHLVGRLGDDAAARHIAAGVQASQHFDRLLADRLTREDGHRRALAVLPAGEVLDRYGRLLAYLTPWFAGGPADPVPQKRDRRRRTFNLDMIESGWGVLFLIYPSIPADPGDYQLAVDAARAAWETRQGMWAEHGDDLLLPYEYRASVRLGTLEVTPQLLGQAFSRICVDLRTGTEVGPYGYHTVPPWARAWIWPAVTDPGATDHERCTGWTAWINAEPGTPPTLHVSAECHPPAGHRVELRMHTPQGFNLEHLLLDVITRPSSGPHRPDARSSAVTYHQPALRRYTHVTLLPSRQTVPVSTAE